MDHGVGALEGSEQIAILRMKTEPLTVISKALCVGLLVLAGILSNTHLALAQSRDACTLPAGATSVAPPDVTAQQVETGSASPREFALAVRDRFRAGAETPEETFYIACLLRQEGSPWRSGSTYLVTLTPDGRIYEHAKSMALAGRLLERGIYGAILQALGIDPAALADPAAAQAAFTAAWAGDGGPFDVPGVPGASGYATVTAPPGFSAPFVLLAGFDLDATHLAAEQIDYGDPAVTAAEVVDRETLKAFVTQAGNYMVDILETGTLVDVAKTKVAFRDPNGPWRHGSVYLYALDLTSNIILFHGAFPDRFENRPLTPTVRDAVTGEFILTQVIEAAKSSLGGGFVEYHFDDPTDPNDSADIPKTGFAREFTARVGPQATIKFVVGSGFYGRAPEAVDAGGNAVVKSVLPQVMRAMTASTVDAVSGRIERATSDTAPAAALSFGGATTLSEALQANAHALGNGTFDLGRLLANSSFTMTLNAAGNGGSGLFGNLTFWGSGDWRSISGGNPRTLDYDGSVTSANLGIDTRLGADMLAGLAVSQARGTVDYTDSNALTGEFTATLTSINPYVGWQDSGGMNLWAAAGYGSGEIEIDDSTGTQASDLTQQMVAAGASGRLVASDQVIEGGTTSLRLKGETAFTRAEIDAAGTLESATLNVSRLRLMLEGTHERKLASGATFSPSIELGMRHDGGDGETGSGIEAGGGLRYADPAKGLTLEGRARTLLSHGGDYEEWGVSGLVRIDPGSAGRGLALSAQPAWGRTGGGVKRLWESGVARTASPAHRAAGRMDAEIAYGLAASDGLGTVTPYAGLGLAGEGKRSWHAGARWRLAPEARLSLDGTWRAGYSGSEHSLTLRGLIHW